MIDQATAQAPMVSVLMTAYKHAPYIKKAIESVLMQETDFEVELIIGDDASPDNTEQIVNELLENHPKRHWVKYTRHPQNKGMQVNGRWVRDQSHGKYLAYCEGDDHWTDPLKLKKQVDFMESNPNMVICGTKCIWDDGKGKRKLNEWKAGPVTLRDLLKENPFATCTVLIRASVRKGLNINFSGFRAGDWPTWYSLLQKGEGYILDFYSAVYLYHGSGAYSGQTMTTLIRNMLENRIAFIPLIAKDLVLYFKWQSFLQLLIFFSRGLRFKKGYLRGLYANRKLIADFFFKY